jgi:HEAT repeats
MVDRRAEAIGQLPRPLRLRAVLAALASGSPTLAADLGWPLLEIVAEEVSNRSKSSVSKALGNMFSVSHPLGPASKVLAARLASVPIQQQLVALSIEGLDWSAIPGLLDSGSFPGDAIAKRSLAVHAALTGRPALAPALIRFLGEPDNDASLAAESALQVLAVAASQELFSAVGEVLESFRTAAIFPAADPARWLELSPADRSALSSAIAEACLAFDGHRRRGVLLSALLLLDRAAIRSHGSPLAAWFGKVEHSSHAALRGALRWCKLPVAGVRSWEWLHRDDLAPAALDRLSRAGTLAEQDGIFSRAPLALGPKRAKWLAQVDLPRPTPTGKLGTPSQTDSFLPARSVMPTLSAAARRGLPRIAALLRGAPKARLSWLEPLLADADPVVRHALVRHLPSRALGDLCLDPDARVARSAFLAWSSAGHLAGARHTLPSAEYQHFIAALARSPHAGVRECAVQERDQSEMPTAGSLAGRLRLRHRLRRDSEAASSYLSAQILGGNGEVRYQAVMLVRRLDKVSQFERELLEVASSGVLAEPNTSLARAAASAVMALGDLKSEASLRGLRQCLLAKDTRVRANSVEALGRRARRRPILGSVLPEELSADSHHRVRGNAVRAMVCLPEPAGSLRASDGLMGMLSDEREMHRAAGAWAAGCALRTSGRERLGDKYPVLLARVCEMARFDESPAVRRRALLAAAQAQTELRAIITGEHESPSASAAWQEASA